MTPKLTGPAGPRLEQAQLIRRLYFQWEEIQRQISSNMDNQEGWKVAMVEMAQEVINWSTLVPVIVGGSIAVVGGALATILSLWLSHRSDKKKKRTEKFEEMLDALYEHDHWLDDIRGIRTYGREAVETISPLPKARTIAAIYFPSFNIRLSELEISARLFGIWMLNAGRKRLEGKIGEINDGMADAYKPYRDKFLELMSEIEIFAQREFR